ncbi:hypothetical protein T10_6729, partial [Trichinella papuae]
KTPAVRRHRQNSKVLPARGTIEHYFKPVSVKQMVPRIDNNKCRETSVSVDDKSSISCSDSASQAASSVWSSTDGAVASEF